MNKAKTKILHFIAENPNATNKNVADCLGLSLRLIIYHLKWLQNNGYIKKNEKWEVLKK